VNEITDHAKCHRFGRTIKAAAAIVMLVVAPMSKSADWLTCRGIDSDEARLACFDAAVAAALQPVSAPATETLVAEVPARSVSEPTGDAADAPDDFGAEDLERSKNIASEVPARISAVLKIDGDTELEEGHRLILDNGQVWQYIDRSDLYVAKRDPVIEIRRNVLGNYFLSIDGSGLRRRVKRIQ